VRAFRNQPRCGLSEINPGAGFRGFRKGPGRKGLRDEHDGAGKLSFEDRPFVVMNDKAFVDLGVVRGL